MSSKDRELFNYAESGDVENVRKILDEPNGNVNINYANPVLYNRTPLIQAIDKNHDQVVELLLSKDADINKADKVGQTPLYIASAKGNEKIVKLLLSKNANIFKKNPIEIAKKRGYNNIANLLERQMNIMGTVALTDNLLESDNPFSANGDNSLVKDMREYYQKAGKKTRRKTNKKKRKTNKTNKMKKSKKLSKSKNKKKNK
jgi:ankyrin repeat protein